MLKDTIKQILPEPLLNTARNTVDGAKRLKDIPDAYWSPERRETIEKLGAVSEKRNFGVYHRKIFVGKRLVFPADIGGA